MQPTYSKHFVAFMDILGYKSLVINADKDLSNALATIKNLDRMIKKCIKNGINEFEKISRVDFEIKYILFSDSLCIFVPANEYEEGEKIEQYNNHTQTYIKNNYLRLWFLCRLIANIQLEALQYGIIFRGAISFGNHYHSKNVTFSKALVDAYQAETSEAIYPRIILLNTPENDILELAPVLYKYFDLRVVEDDDYLFVDYLGKVCEFHGLLKSDCDYIKWHKKIIEKGIECFLGQKHDLLKYTWMMNYHHNRLIPFFGKEICIKDELIAKAQQDILPLCF